MHTFQKFGWVVSLSIVAGGLVVQPASADRSYSDITGTNIWNNNAPIFGTGNRLDPALVERVTQLNQLSADALQECNATLSQLEQIPSARRYTRQPQTPPPVPESCVRVEEIRTEVENVRATLQQADVSNAGFRTW